MDAGVRTALTRGPCHQTHHPRHEYYIPFPQMIPGPTIWTLMPRARRQGATMRPPPPLRLFGGDACRSRRLRLTRTTCS